MRFKHLAAATAASAITALGAVSPAWAGSGSVFVKPHVAMAGDHVTVVATDCDTPTAEAESSAFTAPITLKKRDDDDRHHALTGVATISDDATPGTWKIQVECGGETFTGWVTVVTSEPSGGAATGDGASQASMLGGLGSGASLAAAGVGLGALALRRRRAGARG